MCRTMDVSQIVTVYIIAMNDTVCVFFCFKFFYYIKKVTILFFPTLNTFYSHCIIIIL